MATYTQLYDLRSDPQWGAFVGRVQVAAVVAAQGLIDGVAPTPAQIAWAQGTLDDPRAQADRLVNYVLAANKSATTAQIFSATDTTLQTNIDAAVAKLVT